VSRVRTIAYPYERSQCSRTACGSPSSFPTTIAAAWCRSNSVNVISPPKPSRRPEPPFLHCPSLLTYSLHLGHRHVLRRAGPMPHDAEGDGCRMVLRITTPCTPAHSAVSDERPQGSCGSSMLSSSSIRGVSPSSPPPLHDFVETDERFHLMNDRNDPLRWWHRSRVSNSACSPCSPAHCSAPPHGDFLDTVPCTPRRKNEIFRCSSLHATPP